MNSTYALVLGGTKGLGKLIVDELIERKLNVIVAGRSAQVTDNTSAVVKIPCDLASVDSVVELISTLDRLAVEGVRINEFYWVAGVLDRCSFNVITSEMIIRMIDVNLRNPLLVAQWVWGHMTLGASVRRFAVIASTVGVSDSPRDDEAVYASTKAAQVSFTRAIGKNNEDESLHVSLYCPGGMKTGLWDRNAIDRETYESFLDPQKVASRIVTLTHGQTSDYAETVIPRGSL